VNSTVANLNNPGLAGKIASNPQSSTETDGHFATESGMISSPHEYPAWGVSLVLHLAILLLLGSLTHVTLSQRETIISSVFDDVNEETYKFDTIVVDQIGSQSDINMLSPSLAAAQQTGDNPQKQMRKQFEDELLKIDAPLTNVLPEPAEMEFVTAYDAHGDIVHTGGTEGAIDRLTFEIAGSLRQRKTLVIWLFDTSLSLHKRRNEIADRFANVYRQLGLLDVGAERALQTAVASYGERTNILTKEPVANVDEVAEAIRKIPPDPKGTENVFAAVRTVASKWLTHRTKLRRNVMIIIVTDERGDDYLRVEETVHNLAKFGIRVYCVGNASLFGREKDYVLWEYADGFKEELPVDRGPETVRAERLRLPFWGGTNSRKLQRMSAGYGPYALTRLCMETGGVFFVADESNARFDPAVMRDYRPDYRPIRDYVKDLQNNQTKMALVRAADKTRVEQLRPLQLEFRADNDNILRRQINEAQKPAAEFDDKLQEMLNILAQGEKDRPQVQEPRWRAGYDLAMGRVMAMRARAFGYNRVLAEMKSDPKTFQKKGSNWWNLQPSREITAGSDIRKLAQKAIEYLTRVIDEHPGTPWAMLAKRELEQPLGWAWVEASRFIASVNARPGAKNDAARLRFINDKKKKTNIKKRQRPVL